MSTALDLPVGHVIEKNGESMRRLRPAYRTYLWQWASVLLGVFITIAPLAFVNLLGAIISMGSSSGLLEGVGVETQAMIAKYLRYLGLAGIVAGGALIAYGRLANRFFGSDETIAKEFGIIAKKRNQISLGHVRVVDIQQRWWERLINIGRLEFSTAGTAGVDVTWHGVVSPIAVQRIIQETMNADGADASSD